MSELYFLEHPRSCIYCNAKIFQFEPPTFCCYNGEVQLAPTKVNEELYELFNSCSSNSNEFRSKIRAYNSIFAFTSFGAHIDNNLANARKGIYTFRAQGQIYHSLPPITKSSNGPCYFQLYIYDTDAETKNRLNVLEDLNLSEGLVKKLMDILSGNPYAQFFRSLSNRGILENLQIHIRSDVRVDQRVYNAPTMSQVAAIWIEGKSTDFIERDIILTSHSGTYRKIKHYFGCYDPLQYPILFPNGEVGWHQKSSKKRVSCREYYSYKLQIRENDKSVILYAGRLLHQYVVDMYVKIETSRLDFFRQNQQTIRSDLYKGIIDSVAAGETLTNNTGQKVILPPSFIGGPRDMRRRYLDAMALCQRFGKPDLFITMTCNPDWKEIQNELKPGQMAQDRPDLTTRIFRSKLQDLKDQLFKKSIFGGVAAHVYVIEFQKRGLPHAHFLIILKTAFKITVPVQFDRIVSAELPDPSKYKRLHELVVKHMMHGPCGNLNKNNACMKKGLCKNKYPRSFSSQTIVGDDSYPIYRRRNDGQQVKVRNKYLDNRWVIPYNPYLLSRYNCHINVEICSGIKAVKYIYKYIYKGHDKISVSISQKNGEQPFDEIQQYQDGRWVSAPEALWRIFEFDLNEMYPSVCNLQLHLEDQQSVYYKDNQNLVDILKSNARKKSMLTEFFRINKSNSEAKKYLYITLC
ncbi:hypothetical protein MA16_Dca025242 [Dendrobium catenatum]|uniref:Helitron helicase-like domain-containing protein n=1 Tax=Dendrobium catenatum TaxID=906689 RepID=A0A2I0XEU7_9ASPA|nr:hypothetical protein MA16_Dca025242 [Dendrobium catenatum]